MIQTLLVAILLAGGFTPGKSAGAASPLTTKGDLYTYSTVNDRLPTAADGLCLKTNSVQSTGLEWNTCSAASTYSTVQDEGTPLTQRSTLNLIGAAVTCVDNAGATKTDCTVAAAPVSATYIVQTADGVLTNEQVLGALGTGIVINTTTTGVLSIKGTNTCTNQFARSDTASGTWTCATVVLTADVSGILPVANGGTNLGASAEDNVMVGNATTWQSKTLTSCSATTSAVTYDSTANTFGCNTFPLVQTARLASTHTISATTATEVAMQVSVVGAGTYQVEYQLLTQSSNATNGYKYGVNVTANLTTLKCSAIHPTTSVGTANGIGDDVAAVLTGSIFEALGTTSSASTTAPNLGPCTGVATINTNIHVRVSCIIVTTGAADIELWMGSEAAVAVSTMANSFVIVTRIP